MLSVLQPPVSQSIGTDEHPHLFLPKMSTKQFLVAALACTFLVQTASSQTVCTGIFDGECCDGRNGQACSFKAIGQEFTGVCMSEDVRLAISRRQRCHHQSTESLWSLRARRLTRLSWYRYSLGNAPQAYARRLQWASVALLMSGSRSGLARVNMQDFRG